MKLTPDQITATQVEMKRRHSEEITVTEWNQYRTIFVTFDTLADEIVITREGKVVEWTKSLADLAEQIVL